MAWFSASVILVIFLAGASASNNFFIRKSNPADRGNVTNCDKKNPKFSAWWEPRVLVVGHTYQVSFDFTPRIDWSSGTLIGTVWLDPDPNPIYKTTMPISCEQVKMVKILQCPFKKSRKISFFMPMPFRLPYAFPAGKYKLRAEIQDNSGEDLICAEATIQLAGGGNDMYMDFGNEGKL